MGIRCELYIWLTSTIRPQGVPPQDVFCVVCRRLRRTPTASHACLQSDHMLQLDWVQFPANASLQLIPRIHEKLCQVKLVIRGQQCVLHIFGVGKSQDPQRPCDAVLIGRLTPPPQLALQPLHLHEHPWEGQLRSFRRKRVPLRSNWEHERNLSIATVQSRSASAIYYKYIYRLQLQQASTQKTEKWKLNRAPEEDRLIWEERSKLEDGRIARYPRISCPSAARRFHVS